MYDVRFVNVRLQQIKTHSQLIPYVLEGIKQLVLIHLDKIL